MEISRCALAQTRAGIMDRRRGHDSRLGYVGVDVAACAAHAADDPVRAARTDCFDVAVCSIAPLDNARAARGRENVLVGPREIPAGSFRGARRPTLLGCARARPAGRFIRMRSST